MPYGANHQEIVSDTFDSSIDSSWNTGHGEWNTCVWVTGGHIEADGASLQGQIQRVVSESYSDDQYAIVTVQTFGTVSGTAALCRCQEGADESCYAGTTITAGTDRYEIAEKFSDFSSTPLASTSSGYQAPVAGDTLTLEAEGTTLRFGTDDSGTDVQKLSTTDNTLTSGQPGALTFDVTDAADARMTAWSGGDIGPTLVSLSFGGAGALALSDTLTYDKSLSMSGTGTPSFSRLASHVRSFAFGGVAALTLGRAISLNRSISATGAVESVQGVGATFEGSYTGTGSLSTSSDSTYGKALTYVSSASVAISKRIGKLLSYVGIGTAEVTGDGITPDTGRGILRLLVRTILRSVDRDK